MGMSRRRLSPAIGAEATNVDITRPLDDETVDNLNSHSLNIAYC